MIDQQLVRLRAHRSKIQRYRNLLQTSLTELERQFVEKRLTEEQSSLESVANSLPNDFAQQRARPKNGPGAGLGCAGPLSLSVLLQNPKSSSRAKKCSTDLKVK